MRLQSDSFDIREMVCSESEAAEYSKEVNVSSTRDPNNKKK